LKGKAHERVNIYGGRDFVSSVGSRARRIASAKQSRTGIGNVKRGGLGGCQGAGPEPMGSICRKTANPKTLGATVTELFTKLLKYRHYKLNTGGHLEKSGPRKGLLLEPRGGGKDVSGGKNASARARWGEPYRSFIISELQR